MARFPLPPAIVALPIALAVAAGSGRADAATHRYALSMLHFNVQYVAGGLRGFLQTDDPALDIGAEEVEDSIVRESFEPVLDMLLAHPTWGADVEMQGYMLDVLAARHAPVLDKLRTLATTGQIEVVSFHYSDQLFLAYPREDWARSQKLTQEAFTKHGVPLGKAVFCQEGQAGPGMAAAMKATGYETLVFPKNLFSYQHGDLAPPPLYQLGDVSMIQSRGVSFTEGAETIETNFWFVDDGELLATGDVDPYIQETFKKDPASIAETEANLQSLEAAGYAITTVSKYVAEIEPLVTKVDAPPLLDGTWQPNSTDGIHRWLGGHGLWYKDERDNDVRTLGAMAHRELLAAETIAAKAGIDAQAEIDAGFRLLALGQVTDATGINPFRGEIEYGIAHDTEALRVARDVIERAKSALAAGEVVIDTKTNEVDVAPAAALSPESTAPPITLVVAAGDRSVDERWEKIEEGHFRVHLQFGPGEERVLRVDVPGVMGDLVYTPGLADAPVHFSRGAFVFDHFDLALPDGLIGLGNDQWVIKNQTTIHIGARIFLDRGDISFLDETAPIDEAIEWVFDVVSGDEAQAKAAAEALNTRPEVRR